jgi:NADH-quinone oxidoreductase subunit K
MDMHSLAQQMVLAAEAGATAATDLAPSGVFNLRNCLILGGIIFSIGAWGVIARRNVLIVLISIELMLNAVNLVLASFARAHANLVHQSGNSGAGEMGQIFALFIIAVAAAEAAVGLAIVITYFRNRETVDTREMRLMKQ